MKKLLFLPLILFSIGVSAQTFQLGLKGGVNISNFSGSTFDDVDKKALIGFHGGAFISLLMGDHFAIQPEALFSTQGAKIRSAGQEENLKVSYLNVPVMLKARFNGGLYVEAGPQVGFKLSEDVPDMGIGNFAKNLDLSVGAGLGYHSNSGLGIGARYMAGVSKVGDFDGEDLDPNFKNGVIQISVFYTLFNNSRVP